MEEREARVGDGTVREAVRDSSEKNEKWVGKENVRGKNTFT